MSGVGVVHVEDFTIGDISPELGRSNVANLPGPSDDPASPVPAISSILPFRSTLRILCVWGPNKNMTTSGSRLHWEYTMWGKVE